MTGEPLWDETFRARMLRHGLSDDEIMQAVEAAERAEEERSRYERALQRIAFIGGDNLSPDECVMTLSLARGFALRMLGGRAVGGTQADEIELLAEQVARG